MNKKNGVWVGTRACFWAMVVTWSLASWILAIDIEDSLGIAFSVIACALVIATFVMSIVHLNRYKEKALAVTALVISSIGLLFMIGGFLGA